MAVPTNKLTGFFLSIAVPVTYLAMTANFCYGESFSVLRSSEGDSYKPCFKVPCACSAKQMLLVHPSDPPTCEDIDKIEWSLGTNTIIGCGQLTWSGADIRIASCLTAFKVIEVWNFTKYDSIEVEFSQSESELKLKVDPTSNWSGLLLRVITQCVNASSYQCMLIKVNGERAYPLPQKLFLPESPRSAADSSSAAVSVTEVLTTLPAMSSQAMPLTFASTLTITPLSAEVFPSESTFSGHASSVFVAASTSSSHVLGATSAVSGVPSSTGMAVPSEYSPELDSLSISALISETSLTSSSSTSTIFISSSSLSPLLSASATTSTYFISSSSIYPLPSSSVVSSAAFTALISYSGTYSFSEVFVSERITPTLIVTIHTSLSSAGSALNSPYPSTVVSVSSNTSPLIAVSVSSTTSSALAVFATTSASLSEVGSVFSRTPLLLFSMTSHPPAVTSAASSATPARFSSSSISPSSSILDASRSTPPSAVLTITAVLTQPSSTLLPSASTLPKERGNGVTLAVIAGVAAGGGVAVIVLLIAAIVYCRRRRRRQPQTSVPKDYILYNYASSGPTVAPNQQANSVASPSAPSLPYYSSYTNLSGDGGVVNNHAKFQTPTSRPAQIGSGMNEAGAIRIAGRVVEVEHGADSDASAKKTLAPPTETNNRSKSISKPNYDPPKPPELKKAEIFSSREDIRSDERQKQDPSPISQSLSVKDEDKPARPLPPAPSQIAVALKAALESKKQKTPAVLPKPIQLSKNAGYKTKFDQAVVPSPPALVPSHPALVPSPPALVSSSPALVPSSPALVPSPPALVPSPPTLVPSLPALVPSPPALVSRSPAQVSSPPSLVPNPPALTSRPQSLASSSLVLTSKPPAETTSRSAVASNLSALTSLPPALTSSPLAVTSTHAATTSKPPALKSQPPAKTSKPKALASRHTELDSSPSALTSRPRPLASSPPASPYSSLVQTSSPAAVVQIPVKYNESSDRMPDKSLPRVPHTNKGKERDRSVRLVKNLASQLPKVISKEQPKESLDETLEYIPPSQDKPKTNDVVTRPAVRNESSSDQRRVSNKINSAGSVKPPRPPGPRLLEQRQSDDEPPSRPPPKLPMPQGVPPSKDIPAPKLSPNTNKNIKDTGASGDAPENVIKITDPGKPGSGSKQAPHGDTSSKQQDHNPSFEKPVTYSSPSNGNAYKVREKQDQQQTPGSGQIPPAMNTPRQQIMLPPITESPPVVPKPKARKSSDQVAISGQEVEISGAEARDSFPGLMAHGDYSREVPENILPRPVPAQRKPRLQTEDTPSPPSGVAYNIV